MTNEERDLITAFITRVAGAAPAQPPAGPPAGPWGSPSVPATATPPLPPIDPEADGLLASLFQSYPQARYRLAQLAFVQEHALAAAQARIAHLEAQLRQAAQPQHSGFFSGLFGGGRPATSPAMSPGPASMPPVSPPAYFASGPGAYPAGARPMGMLQRSGPGFLGSALTTAAGVAGGMMLGNTLMNLFSSGAGGIGSAQAQDAPWGPPPEPTNQSAWAAPDPSADPGSWADPGADPDTDAGAAPLAGPGPGDSGWDQGDSGWDQGGGEDDTLV